MLQSNNIIKDGDTLIIFEDMKPKQMITIKDGQTFQNKSGAYHHSNIIGQKVGQKIWSKSNQGFIYLMKPSPFIITETVPHKTQILFQMDISMILVMLDIRGGKNVVESGTGSGSLTCSISQALQPTGKLYTYEFNEDRANNGQELIQKLKFQDTTSVFWRDVYGNGFTQIESDNQFNEGKIFPQSNSIDAIFLDLPQPWLAMHHAKNVIKNNGRICTFSPCIEQVQRSCLKLKELGFRGIQTIECLKRQFERRVKTQNSLFKRSGQELQGVEQVEKKIKVNDADVVVKSDLDRYDSQKKIYYTAGVAKAYGHTGYLTFAFLP